MKKSLFVLVIMIFFSGCSMGNGKEINIEKIDSKIDYILFRDRKIYLTDKFNDFVLQFKGLSCKLEADGAKNFFNKINIDDINSKEHEFYKLMTTSTSTESVTVECENEKSYFGTSFSVFFNYDPSGDEVLYSEREIDDWHISPQENIDVYIEGKKLSYGGDDATEATREDVVKIMGTNYELDYDDDISYKIGKYQYDFSFISDDTLSLIGIEKR